MGSSNSSNPSNYSTKLKEGHNKIKISGCELSEDWGTEGLEIFLIRKRIVANNFHWGVAIECLKNHKFIVVNRHEGLSITKTNNFEEALNETLGYNAEIPLKEASKFFNFGNNVIYSQDEHKWRMLNGPKEYEYQSIGKINQEDLSRIFINHFDENRKNLSEEIFYDYLIRRIKNIKKIEDPCKDNYNLLTNNCQHFAYELIKIFRLENNVLFAFCNSIDKLINGRKYLRDVKFLYSKEIRKKFQPKYSDFVKELN